MASHIFLVMPRCTPVGSFKICQSLLGQGRCWRGYSSGSKASEEGRPEEKQETEERQQRTEGKSEEPNEDEIKKRILDSSLPFVHNQGWSVKAIAAGAESIGYPGTIHGLFPRGGYDLVHHFYLTCNFRLAEQLIKQAEEMEKDPSQRRSERETVERAVQTRLAMIIPYVSVWPQALALSSLPPNAPLALANLLTLVDDICYHAGDRSANMTWYSKRLGLALVYKMTELYMLQDGSEGKDSTWEFLHRRMEEAAHLKDLIRSSDQAVNFTKELGLSAFITARNILGMNWNR